jgi:multidrug efflux pump subunit AcrA (membrane-fusion protein)
MLLKYGIPVIAVLLLTVAVYHVIHTYPAGPLAAPPVPPAESPFPQGLTATGIVEPRSNQIAIAAPVPGIVAEVFVTVGQQVSTGAPLFRLDERSLQAELQIREARLTTARAQHARLEEMPRKDEVAVSAARMGEARANLAMQQARLERAQTLLKDKLLSPPEVEQIRQAVAAAQQQLARAEAEDRMLRKGAWEPDQAIARTAVAEAEALVAQGKTELARLTVCAPVPATVLQVNIRRGEAVGNGPPIVLGDIDCLHLRVEIPEEKIAAWRAQAPVRATPRGQRQPAVNPRFVRVEPVVVPRRALTGDPSERSDTRVLQVIYEFDPGQAAIFVGQQMDVFIATETAEKP